MPDTNDWKFPTNPRSRHPSAEDTRRTERSERVYSELETWRSAARNRPRAPERRLGLPRLFRGLGLLLALLALAGAAGAWIMSSVYEDRIGPNVVAGDVPVGSLTRDEAAERLDERLRRFAEEPVTLRLGERVWQPSAEELGMSVDLERTLDRAFATGREQHPTIGAAYALLGWARPATVPLVLMLDEHQMRRYLEDIANEVQQDSTSPRILVEGTTVRVQGGAEGQTFLREETESRLRSALLSLSPGPVDVQVYRSSGPRDEAALRGAEARARKAVSGPVVLEAEGARREIPAAQLGEWLRTGTKDPGEGGPGITVSLDPAPLRTYLRGLARAVEQPARSVRLQWVAGQVQVAQPSQPGRELDLEAATKAVEQAAFGDNRIVRLPVRTVAPTVTEGVIQSLGIRQALGTGEAHYGGSPPEHAENASRAADAVTGYVVAQGMEFSLLEAVGQVGEAQGYRPELVGDGERGFDGPWAGISEVSTAVFRAALATGLPVQERNPAPYRVPYFEQEGQGPGREAVVSLGSEDLRFLNDTGAAILVQVLVGENEMRVELYGTDPGRRAELSTPQITNITAPRGELRWTDPAAEGADVRLYAPAAPGAEVLIRRRVLQRGQPTLEESIFTRYEPLPPVYARGR